MLLFTHSRRLARMGHISGYGILGLPAITANEIYIETTETVPV